MSRHPFPAPTTPATDRREVLLDYLAFFRAETHARVESLAPDDRRRSILPSAWSPLELLHHLLHVERRWLEWGFAGAEVTDPWADEREGRWHVDPDLDLDDLRVLADRQAATTARVVRSHALDDVGAPGPRWDGAPPATLERVLLHLLQEHARHAGHLDVVAELLGGSTGEGG